MKQYTKLVRHVMNNGAVKGDRTGTGTKSWFGYHMRFDMHDGFPLLTTKKTHWKSVWTELVWFIKGDTNTKFLKDNKCSIWDEWANKDGDLGPVYGKQWRSWGDDDGETIDQLRNVIEDLKTNPFSRRHIVTAWNPSVVPDSGLSFEENIANGKQALPPCHLLFQFDAQPISYVLHDGFVCYEFEGRLHKTQYTNYSDVVLLPQYALNLMLTQRSGDIMLGIPFNIASYAALLHIVAHLTNMVPGSFIHSIGDAHIYNNHMAGVREFLSRDPELYKLPSISISPRLNDIDDIDLADVMIDGYEFQPHIKFDVAI